MQFCQIELFSTPEIDHRQHEGLCPLRSPFSRICSKSLLKLRLYFHNAKTFIRLIPKAVTENFCLKNLKKKPTIFYGHIWTSQWACSMLYGPSLRKRYVCEFRRKIILVATIRHTMITVLRFLTKVKLDQGNKWCMKQTEFSRDLRYLEVWPCVTHIILNMYWGNVHLFVVCDT